MYETHFKVGTDITLEVDRGTTAIANLGDMVEHQPNLISLTFDKPGKAGNCYSPGVPPTSTRLQFNWLTYVAGHTTYTEIQNNDILTGPMSGCFLSCWQENNRWYVGHTGTDHDQAQNRQTKRHFAQNMERNTTGFNPKELVPNNQKMTKEIKKKGFAPGIVLCLGLITTTRQFYSIVLYRKDKARQNLWYCAHVKKMPPMSYQTLYDRLMA